MRQFIELVEAKSSMTASIRYAIKYENLYYRAPGGVKRLNSAAQITNFSGSFDKARFWKTLKLATDFMNTLVEVCLGLNDIDCTKFSIVKIVVTENQAVQVNYVDQALKARLDQNLSQVEPSKLVYVHNLSMVKRAFDTIVKYGSPSLVEYANEEVLKTLNGLALAEPELTTLGDKNSDEVIAWLQANGVNLRFRK